MNFNILQFMAVEWKSIAIMGNEIAIHGSFTSTTNWQLTGSFTSTTNMAMKLQFMAFGYGH